MAALFFNSWYLATWPGSTMNLSHAACATWQGVEESACVRRYRFGQAPLCAQILKEWPIIGLQTLVHTAATRKCRHSGQESMARDRDQESHNLPILVFQVCGKLTGALIRQGAENLVCEDSIQALQQSWKRLEIRCFWMWHKKLESPLWHVWSGFSFNWSQKSGKGRSGTI